MQGIAPIDSHATIQFPPPVRGDVRIRVVGGIACAVGIDECLRRPRAAVCRCCARQTHRRRCRIALRRWFWHSRRQSTYPVSRLPLSAATEFVSETGGPNTAVAAPHVAPLFPEREIQMLSGATRDNRRRGLPHGYPCAPTVGQGVVKARGIECASRHLGHDDRFPPRGASIDRPEDHPVRFPSVPGLPVTMAQCPDRSVDRAGFTFGTYSSVCIRPVIGGMKTHCHVAPRSSEHPNCVLCVVAVPPGDTDRCRWYRRRFPATHRTGLALLA